jgi:hypothetical protein
MKTFTVLAVFTIAMIAIENIPDEIAGAIGLALITALLIFIITAIAKIGKKNN